MTINGSNKKNQWGYFSLIKPWLEASALLALLFSTAILQAQVKVLEVRDLKFLPERPWSEARDINSLGQVVGVSRYAANYYGRAFLWTEAGGMHELPVGSRSKVNAINDHSQIAGSDSHHEHDVGSSFWAAFWESGPGYEEYDLCTVYDYGEASAYDINNRGQVVAYCDPEEPGGEGTGVLFVWTKEAGGQGLPVLPGAGWWESRPSGINDLGQIVGTSKGHAVLWNPVYTGYRIQDLGPGSAYRIDNLGQIVGESGGQAVLWKPGTSGYKLQNLGPSAAHAINELGMVVGDSGGHGFVWSAAGGMQDLGILPGFTSSIARAINNLGQVVGSSQELSWDTDGNVTVLQSHATRWTLSLPPELGSAFVVQPAFGQVGQELTVRIHVASAHFEKGTTIARFGEAISVGVQPIGDGPIKDAHFGDFGYVIVTSPTEAVAAIRIDSSATPGPRTVLVNTGTEHLAFRNAFTVSPPGDPSASSVLTLLSPTTPDRGTPDQGLIAVSGTNFPEGNITPEQVSVLLEPGPIARKEKREGLRTGSIPTVFTTATSISASNDGSREVSFRIPDMLTFHQGTDYLVSIFGQTSSSGLKGTPFASGNRAALWIDPTQAVKLIPLACGRESSLRSVQEFTPTAIRFINWSTQVIRIYWLNYEGKRVFMHTLKAGGAAYTQPTFVTHPWLVTDNDGHCLGIFLPNERLGFAAIY